MSEGEYVPDGRGGFYIRLFLANYATDGLQGNPLENLHIAKLNIFENRLSETYYRQSVNMAQQALLVKREEVFGGAAGRRRWFGLKQVEQITGEIVYAPHMITGEVNFLQVSATVLLFEERPPAAQRRIRCERFHQLTQPKIVAIRFINH